VLVLIMAAAGAYLLWPSTAKHGAKPVMAQPTVTVSGPTTTRAIGWTDHDLHPVTAPVIVAGTVVVYTADGGHLSLRALDPATGRTLWSRPTSVAGNTQGQPLQIAHVGGTVFMLGPPDAAGGLAAPVLAVDVATGTQLWATKEAALFAEPPTLCSDGKALCGAATASGVLYAVRIDLADGRFHQLSEQGGRLLGAGILDPELRSPEYVERLAPTTGQPLWRDRVDTLFGGPVSSDYGWNWDDFGGVDVGWLAPMSSDNQASKDLSLQKTVGVRASDGKRLWVAAGLYGCPAQGLAINGKPFAVRCVFKAGDQLDVSLEGFNVRTGAATWSAGLGNAPAVLGSGSTGLIRIDAAEFVIRTAAHTAKQVNLVTGTVQQPAANLTGWCISTSFFLDKDTLDDQGQPTSRATGLLITTCTAQGLPSVPADGSATGMGVSAAGHFIWSAPDGIDSYPLPVS
jgi:outer membrane protein assembly factor BamB